MAKVKVISAYVPLPVKHLSRDAYKELGDRLVACAPNNFRVFYDYPLDQCWAYQFRDLPPAQPVASDRYATPQDFVLSNIVQHQRTTWARMAAIEDPDADIIAWLDYGILKQGAFTGRPVQPHMVTEFVQRLENSNLTDIPFPGIWQRGEISDTGDNWRFVGSTHIWPRQYLDMVDLLYKVECRRFIERTKTVSNDLPIWAHVEQSWPLPFRFYPANHDATQLTNFGG